MAQTVKDFENYDVTSLDYDKSELLVELQRIVYLWHSGQKGLGSRLPMACLGFLLASFPDPAWERG